MFIYQRVYIYIYTLAYYIIYTAEKNIHIYS